MAFKAKLATVLGYRVLPTSVLVILTYLTLFISLIATNVLPEPPAVTNRGGLDLKQAYEDLLHITAHPHPYNSHANDRVRSYLLQRLQLIAQDYPYLHVDDDLRSNGSWAREYGIYFEGTNLLVKIDGTSSSPDSDSGVLFSAHYDSVSTAPGATDDGMGVVTLLQLVQYFASNRMPRTAVFNINNGEEDWLNGAHAFLQHPWSNLTDVFLNLEGAASGGWPILFRASSTSSVRSFRDTNLVPHPHANVLSSDAFSRGFIRSGTDYSVYNTPGPRKAMDGLDLAFYKGRSRYHTKYDSVSFMLGGQRSLWSMMETARGVGINLLTAPSDADAEDVESVPVYFDLFKSIILVFPISKFLTLNIVALVVTPIVLVLFALCEHFLADSSERQRVSEPTEPSHVPFSRRHLHRRSGAGPSNRSEPEENLRPSPTIHWLEVVWRHLKFWVALGVVIALQYLLIWGYVLFNPFAIYSLPYNVLLAFLSLTYLTIMFVLTFPSSLPFYFPKYHALASAAIKPTAQRQKHTIFFHLYIFTWILLVLSTLGITKLHPPLGSGYLFTTWNIAVATACLLVAVESLVLASLGSSPPTVAELDTNQGNQPEGGSTTGFSRAFVLSDERTPLIPRDEERHWHDGSLLPSLKDLSGEEDERETGSLATWWWIPQFLVSVPAPIILFAHVAMITLDGMAQTLADGSSPWDVYAMVGLLTLFLVLPLAPFSYKLRPFRPLTVFFILVFVLSTLYTWLAFPFGVQEPLKIYFQQRVILPPISTFSSPTRNISGEASLITTLIGPERYLRSSLVPTIPSSQQNPKSLTCGSNRFKRGLTKCEWESGHSMKPVPGTASVEHAPSTDQTKWEKGEFLKADLRKTGGSTARFHVRGRNTRSCRMYFDSHPIFRYDVPASDGSDPSSSGKGMQKGYEVPASGIKEVRLWSRTWENEFVVDVDWSKSTGEADERRLEGRIACEWSEYESAMVDNGPLEKRPPSEGEDVDDGRAKIPAFEEVLHFLPHWAVVSKAADGLVEVWAPFVV